MTDGLIASYGCGTVAFFILIGGRERHCAIAQREKNLNIKLNIKEILTGVPGPFQCSGIRL